MDIESIKQIAVDVNNVAGASYRSGKEHADKSLVAKIEKIKNQYSVSVMYLCENKPPELFNGFNACLSCKLRDMCRLLYKEI